MASKLISYRLEDDLVEALTALSEPGESLNLTAQRLMKQMLLAGVDKTVNSSVDSSVNSPVDNQLQAIEEAGQDVIAQLQGVYAKLADQLNKSLNLRLGEFVMETQSAQSLETEREVLTQRILDLEQDFSDSLDQLQGAKHKLRDAQQELLHTRQELTHIQQELVHTQQELVHTRQQLVHPQLPDAAYVLEHFRSKSKLKIGLPQMEIILGIIADRTLPASSDRNSEQTDTKIQAKDWKQQAEEFLGDFNNG